MPYPTESAGGVARAPCRKRPHAGNVPFEPEVGFGPGRKTKKNAVGAVAKTKVVSAPAAPATGTDPPPSVDVLAPIEHERVVIIAKNQERMRALGIGELAAEISPKKAKVEVKSDTPAAKDPGLPSRRSGRVRNEPPDQTLVDGIQINGYPNPRKGLIRALWEDGIDFANPEEEELYVGKLAKRAAQNQASAARRRKKKEEKKEAKRKKREAHHTKTNAEKAKATIEAEAKDEPEAKEPEAKEEVYLEGAKECEIQMRASDPNPDFDMHESDQNPAPEVEPSESGQPDSPVYAPTTSDEQFVIDDCPLDDDESVDDEDPSLDVADRLEVVDRLEVDLLELKGRLAATDASASSAVANRLNAEISAVNARFTLRLTLEATRAAAAAAVRDRLEAEVPMFKARQDAMQATAVAATAVATAVGALNSQETRAVAQHTLGTLWRASRAFEMRVRAYEATDPIAMALEMPQAPPKKRGRPVGSKTRKEKRPYTPGPYVNFFKVVRPRIVKEIPGCSPQDAVKRLGEMWRGMSDDEKATYRLAARPVSPPVSPETNDGIPGGSEGARNVVSSEPEPKILSKLEPEPELERIIDERVEAAKEADAETRKIMAQVEETKKASDAPTPVPDPTPESQPEARGGRSVCVGRGRRAAV